MNVIQQTKTDDFCFVWWSLGSCIGSGFPSQSGRDNNLVFPALRVRGRPVIIVGEGRGLGFFFCHFLNFKRLTKSKVKIIYACTKIREVFLALHKGVKPWVIIWRGEWSLFFSATFFSKFIGTGHYLWPGGTGSNDFLRDFSAAHLATGRKRKISFGGSAKKIMPPHHVKSTSLLKKKFFWWPFSGKETFLTALLKGKTFPFSSFSPPPPCCSASTRRGT